MVFRGQTVGTKNERRSGIWAGHAQSIRLVAREGAPAPDIEGRVTFENFGTLPSLIDDLGGVVFLASIKGEGVDKSNNEGIWYGPPGDSSQSNPLEMPLSQSRIPSATALRLVARKGDYAVGIPGVARWKGFFGGPILSPSGQVAFCADVVYPDRTLDAEDRTPSSSHLPPATVPTRGVWATDRSRSLLLVAPHGTAARVHGKDHAVQHAYTRGDGIHGGGYCHFNRDGQLMICLNHEGEDSVGTRWWIATISASNTPGTIRRQAKPPKESR